MTVYFISLFIMSGLDCYIDNLKIFINLQDKEIKAKEERIRKYTNIIMEQQTYISHLEDKIRELTDSIEKMKDTK